MIPPVSLATSEPEPIAIPISAAANAGASLTPSPTIATTWPLLLQLMHDLRLVAGQHLGDDAVDPDLPGDRLGRALVIPVKITT